MSDHGRLHLVSVSADELAIAEKVIRLQMMLEEAEAALVRFTRIVDQVRWSIEVARAEREAARPRHRWDLTGEDGT
jgi:hypothetical protein